MNNNTTSKINPLLFFHNGKPRGQQVPVTMFPVFFNVSLKSGVTICCLTFCCS